MRPKNGGGILFRAGKTWPFAEGIGDFGQSRQRFAGRGSGAGNFGFLNLYSSVGRGGVYGYGGAGQGATTRNGYSIPRSCNAAMRRQNRAIRHVADLPSGQNDK